MLNYFSGLMSEDCFKTMMQKPAQNIAIEQGKQAYEDAITGQLDKYFSYVLFPSIVSNNGVYMVVYDLYKATFDKLNQFIGAADFVKFSSLFRKTANSCGMKPYFRKHFAINHKKPVLCLDGFGLDDKKFYELVEKYYKLKIPKEDRFEVNFPFTPNTYGVYEEYAPSNINPYGMPFCNGPYVPPGYGYGNPFGQYQAGPYVPPGFGYGNPFGFENTIRMKRAH